MTLESINRYSILASKASDRRCSIVISKHLFTPDAMKELSERRAALMKRKEFYDRQLSTPQIYDQFEIEEIDSIIGKYLLQQQLK